MGLNQLTLQLPLIKLEDDNPDFFRQKFIKDNPEVLEKFVNLPHIKPEFEKYIQEHQKSPSNKQENSEQKSPKPTPTDVAILSRTDGDKEKLREWGIDI